MKRRALLAAIILGGSVLAACDTQEIIEPTPGALRGPGGTCEGQHLDPGESVKDDWGSATGVLSPGGVEYQVNDGWTVTFCAKGGPDNNTLTVTGPASGTLSTPPNPGGQLPDLSHWSVTGVTPPTTDTTGAGAATTTTLAATTTTVAAVATTTLVPSTTMEPATTFTQAGVTTTLIEGESTTTTPQGITTLDPGGTTTTDGEIGGAGQTTTTDGELGGAGQTTAPGGDGEGDASTTTRGVAGSDVLPETGGVDSSVAGLATLLVIAGMALILLAKRGAGATD